MLAYHGYTETDGRIALVGNQKLPMGKRVVVTVLDDIAIEDSNNININNVKKQRKAFEKFISALEANEDEPLGEEFDEIISHKFNITRELDL